MNREPLAIPDQHWPFLDRFSRPNKSKEDTDE